jgi:hypothetical protein
MVDPAADLRPDHWQLVTLIVIGGYSLLTMFLWNLPGVRSVLYPFKVLTVAFHEVRSRARGCRRAPHTAWPSREERHNTLPFWVACWLQCTPSSLPV